MNPPLHPILLHSFSFNQLLFVLLFLLISKASRKKIRLSWTGDQRWIAEALIQRYIFDEIQRLWFVLANGSSSDGKRQISTWPVPREPRLPLRTAEALIQRYIYTFIFYLKIFSVYIYIYTQPKVAKATE